MRIIITLLLLTFSSIALAASDDIPLNEKSFVEAVQQMDTSRIQELLGDPDRTIEVKDEASGDIIGQIWHFQYLNTSEEGDYYKGTELDIIGDRVVTVVFTNSEMEVGTPESLSELECPRTC